MSEPYAFKLVPAKQAIEDLDYAPHEVVIYDDSTPAPAGAPVGALVLPAVNEKLAAVRPISNPAGVTTATLAKRFNQLLEALQE